MTLIQYDISFINNLKRQINDKISEDNIKRLLIIKEKNLFNVSSNKDKVRNNSNNKNTWRNNNTVKVEKPSFFKKIPENQKKIFVLLNKLSQSNFSIISDQIIELISKETENKSILKTLIHQLFKSATIQVHFCSFYAKICYNLINKFDKIFIEIELSDRINTQISSLIDYTKSVSEKDYIEFCDDIAFKNRYIGCYQFIIELFNNNCLSLVKIREVINNLYHNINLLDNISKIDILVECICKIYKNIDNSKLKGEEIKDNLKIIKIILKNNNKKLNCKSRFRLEELLE